MTERTSIGSAVGRIQYDGLVTIEIDDRVLAHLQVVMLAKLRRAEAFSFAWSDDIASGGGRTVIWVHPRSALAFEFFGSRPPAINAAWVEALMLTANAPTGLRVVDEPEPASYRGPGSTTGDYGRLP